MTDELLVAEYFGPTFQGEGPLAGQLAVFLRLSRCNLDCSWCDTPYTWDPKRFSLAAETIRSSPPQILRDVLAIETDLVVITGGEPLLQQDRLAWLVDMCRVHGRRVEIETNGTVVPSPGLLGAANAFNVSPKLANSGIPRERRIRDEPLGRCDHPVRWRAATATSAPSKTTGSRRPACPDSSPTSPAPT